MLTAYELARILAVGETAARDAVPYHLSPAEVVDRVLGAMSIEAAAIAGDQAAEAVRDRSI